MIAIRRCSVPDLAALMEIDRLSFPDTYDKEFWQYLLSNGVCLGAEDGGSLVGYAAFSVAKDPAQGRLSLKGRKVGHVVSIAVHPQRRGSGIATQLMGKVHGELSGMGIGKVQLEVRKSNIAARLMYQKLGYRFDRLLPGYYHGKEDGLLLETDLEHPSVEKDEELAENLIGEMKWVLSCPRCASGIFGKPWKAEGGTEYCERCGSKRTRRPVGVLCEVCGAYYEYKQKHCGKCGASLPDPHYRWESQPDYGL